MTYRTTLTEAQVLDYFWTMYRHDEAGEWRCDLLRQVADVRVECWSPNQDDVRASVGETTRMLTKPDRCQACRTGDWPLNWHHIVQVQHGGSNTPRNFIALCPGCHRGVHPWLPPSTARRRTGFAAVRELMASAFNTLQRAWDAKDSGRR